MANPITRNPGYLSRNPYSYCFRIRVPNDLRAAVRRKELRYAIRTGYLSQAKLAARALAIAAQHMFMEIRRHQIQIMKLSDDQVHSMIQRYFDKVRKGYEVPLKPIEQQTYDDIPPFYDHESFRGYVDGLTDIKDDILLELSTGDYGRVLGEVRGMLKEMGIGEVDETSPAFRKLCNGFMRVELRGLDYHKSALLGICTDEIERIISNPAVSPVPEQCQSLSAATKNDGKMMKNGQERRGRNDGAPSRSLAGS